MCKLLTLPHFPSVGKLKTIFKIIFKTILSFGIGLLLLSLNLILHHSVTISVLLCIKNDDDDDDEVHVCSAAAGRIGTASHSLRVRRRRYFPCGICCAFWLPRPPRPRPRPSSGAIADDHYLKICLRSWNCARQIRAVRSDLRSIGITNLYPLSRQIMLRASDKVQIASCFCLPKRA